MSTLSDDRNYSKIMAANNVRSPLNAFHIRYMRTVFRYWNIIVLTFTFTVKAIKSHAKKTSSPKDITAKLHGLKKKV